MTQMLPPTPYRDAEVQAYCKVCSQEASYCCPMCGSTFCIDHATFPTCCADCDFRLSARAHRWTTIGLAASGLGGLAGYLLAASFAFAPGAALGGALLAGMVCGLLARRSSRPRGPQLLDNATLKIAPATPEDLNPRLESRGQRQRLALDTRDYRAHGLFG
jgi:hypothetical protein